MNPPVVAILGGTGALGRGLAKRCSRAGYPVVLGSRDAGRAARAASEVAATKDLAGAVAGATNDEAARRGEIVVLSVPFASQSDLLRGLGDALEGKLVICASVPLVPPKVRQVHLPPEGSAAQAAQDVLGEGVRVVSALQNVSANLIGSTSRVDCDVLVTGDAPSARAIAIGFLQAIGMRAWDAGPLANAVAAESLTPVLLHLGRAYGLSSPGLRLTSATPPRKKREGAPPPPRRLDLVGLIGVPLVSAGDALERILGDAIDAAGERLLDEDVLVVAQKIVSRAEGRAVRLRDVEPSARAQRLSAEVEMDARLVELILAESIEVVAHRAGVLIVAHRSGVVMANAGIDRSNVEGGGEDTVLLLPSDADRSAEAMRAALAERYGARVGVIVSDTVGRAWRCGAVGLAIGVAGMTALEDLRGRRDLLGRRFVTTTVGRADEIASAASLVMGQADEGIPAVIVRGLSLGDEEQTAADLQRPKETDLFR